MKPLYLFAVARGVLLLVAFVVDAQLKKDPSATAETAEYHDPQQTTPIYARIPEAGSSSNNSQPKFVSCRLDLELDDGADETAWEIRGPFPNIDLVMERGYDHYRKSDLVAFENVALLVNETYSFILLDRAGNGIQGDDKKFTIYNVDNESPILLKRDKTGDIGEGKLFKFTVRETHAPMFASPETSSSSSSSEPAHMPLQSSVTTSVQQYMDWIRKSIS